MIEERIFFGAILIAIIVILILSTSALKKHLLKWLGASLIMPVLVAIFRSGFGGLVLLFWPGSIVLISLGANERPWSDIAHAWGSGIILNLGLYFILGLFSYFMVSKYKKHNKSFNFAHKKHGPDAQ